MCVHPSRFGHQSLLKNGFCSQPLTPHDGIISRGIALAKGGVVLSTLRHSSTLGTSRNQLLMPAIICACVFCPTPSLHGSAPCMSRLLAAPVWQIAKHLAVILDTQGIQPD
jgi:hypothetical protein